MGTLDLIFPESISNNNILVVPIIIRNHFFNTRQHTPLESHGQGKRFHTAAWKLKRRNRHR